MILRWAPNPHQVFRLTHKDMVNMTPDQLEVCHLSGQLVPTGVKAASCQCCTRRQAGCSAAASACAEGP